MLFLEFKSLDPIPGALRSVSGYEVQIHGDRGKSLVVLQALKAGSLGLDGFSDGAEKSLFCGIRKLPLPLC